MKILMPVYEVVLTQGACRATLGVPNRQKGPNEKVWTAVMECPPGSDLAAFLVKNVGFPIGLELVDHQ